MRVNSEDLQTAVEVSVWTLKNQAPRRPWAVLKHPERKTTDNLKYNSIREEKLDDSTFRIYVDEEIAPYMPYTNEKWISPRWKGAKNPNENWFDEAVEEIAKELAASLGGKLIIKPGEDDDTD